MRRYIVVAYDIVDDQRRNKVSDILLAYGQRVNKSVFECFLKEKEIDELKSRIGEEINKKEDVVLYYYLCKNCLERIERWGLNFEENQIVKTI